VLRFISLRLRRTDRTPRHTRFARLGLGAYHSAIRFVAFTILPEVITNP
jgi:hypothetical protein